MSENFLRGLINNVSVEIIEDITKEQLVDLIDSKINILKSQKALISYSNSKSIRKMLKKLIKN